MLRRGRQRRLLRRREETRRKSFRWRCSSRRLLILDETDSGLDIDALKIVSEGVNRLRSPERSMIVITHYQRLLDHIVPGRRARAVEGPHRRRPADKELALELEKAGYDRYQKRRGMSLRAALRTGDLSALPSRREEGWRWTDLRGLIRALPEPATAANAPAGGGPFAGVEAEELLFVNGFGPTSELVVTGRKVVRLRLLAEAAEATSRAELSIRVEQGASLTLLESHEAGGAGHIADVSLNIAVQPWRAPAALRDRR